jgi:hypothetical protein
MSSEPTSNENPDLAEAPQGSCVVLDTNVWREQPLLRTSHGAALIFALERRGIQLGLPEVVEREIPEVLVRAAQKLLDKTALLAQITGQRADWPDESSVRNAVADRLTELDNLLIRVPMTFEHASAALTRVIGGLPPSREGKEEFKDSLILEAVLELAASRPTDFISSDSGFQNGKQLPHPELRSYVESRSLQVGFCRSLEEYLSQLGDGVPGSDYPSVVESVATRLHGTAQDAMTPYGLSVEGLIDGNLELFATETPGRTAVSFEIRYSARGADPAQPVTTVVKVRGEATANFKTRLISDIRTEEVKFVERDGSERGAVFGSTLEASGSLVREEIPFETPFRFDFVAPIELGEPPLTGKTVFDGEVVPNPTLEQLRESLANDPRWELARVAPLRPDVDHERQHVIVWAEIPDSDEAATLKQAQAAIVAIVQQTIEGAFLLNVVQSGM